MYQAPARLVVVTALTLFAARPCLAAGEPPLLANPGKRNYAAVFCEGQPDDAVLPQDPRELIQGDLIDSKTHDVHFNDPWEDCHTEALFETQARQNAILEARGQTPIYSAKPRPKTCGAWRAAVTNGYDYITKSNITDGILPAEGLYLLALYLGYPEMLTMDPQATNALLAKIAQQRYGWSPSLTRNPFPLPGEDPNGTDGGSGQLPLALVQTRDESGKWTGMLGVRCMACHLGQIGTGEVAGRGGEVGGDASLYGANPHGIFIGMNGGNVDLGLLLSDISIATAMVSPFSPQVALANPGHMANATRGSNAADSEIYLQATIRDFDTLDHRPGLSPRELGRLIPSVGYVFGPASGDQDMPSWWWAHNKTRYLWMGLHSNDSARANMYPASTNPNGGHWNKAREGTFEDAEIWLQSVEAPAYPHGFCTGPNGVPGPTDDPGCINQTLANQGAILFHSKNLWAGSGNQDIPKPAGGNGSCANCHGAYSPRFANQPGFLPDPRLIGMTAYTAPLEQIDTDPASTTSVAPWLKAGIGTYWWSYPDAVEGYRLPEEKTPQDEGLDDFGILAGLNGASLAQQGRQVCATEKDPGCAWAEPLFEAGAQSPGEFGALTKQYGRVRGACPAGSRITGYVAPPLHGVWASAPYFHNGSVPTVWDVLKPADRPAMWLRQQVPPSEATPHGERGFDHVLSRAYDYERMGWKYERMDCNAKGGVPFVTCQPAQKMAPALAWVKDILTGSASAATAPLTTLPPLPGAAGVDQRAVYNSNLNGKKNRGHEFTRVLTDKERRAILEYLKTL